MAHSVGEQAARAVKNSERKKIEEKRTPEEILKGIRGNLAVHLYVTPNDIQFLLTQYDAASAIVTTSVMAVAVLNAKIEALQGENTRLNEQVEQFRTVYEQENRSGSVLLSEDGVVQLADEIATGVSPIARGEVPNV